MLYDVLQFKREDEKEELSFICLGDKLISYERIMEADHNIIIYSQTLVDQCRKIEHKP